MRTCPSRWLVLACLMVRAAGVALGAERPDALVAFTTDDAHVVVSRQGEDLLRLGLVAWGPKWAWTGMQGTITNEDGTGAGTLAGKMGGTGTPFQAQLRARRTAPAQLQCEYQLRSEQDTDLTLVIVELAPGKMFQGREAIVESEGRQATVRCPFERRGLGSRVERVRLTDRRGAVTVIRFDPPCEIQSDGPARVVLAKDRLAGGSPRRLTLTVDLPQPVDWYPSPADLPDEPGLGDWYTWEGTGEGRGPLGMEDWIEAPAGKHGRIVRSGDQLLYGDKPIKLWGLNLCYGDCAPEKELADRRAKLYRKYGINAVRLHKFADGPGWAGIQSKESCVEFDPAALDRMDYQVAKLKQAGIYVKLSAHFGTLKLGPADKSMVPYIEEFGQVRRSERVETPHSAIHYSPELQEVQIRQIVNLLEHRNPHTGLSYAEDPAVAYLEIINEQSIFFFTSMAPLKQSLTLRKQVGERFSRWLGQRYGSAEKLEAAWGKAAFNSFQGDGFSGDESLEGESILPLGNPWYWDPDQLAGSQKFRRRRLLDSLEFLYELQRDFFLRYGRAVRKAGYRGELVSSNWQAGRAFSHFANLHSDYLVGTIDRHNYFGGGQANATMLAGPGSGMLSSGMQQVADRPFMLSEWIHVFPNQWGVEGPAILGAYGMGLQGWDVSFMFQNGDRGAFSQRLGRQQWDVMAPQILGAFPAIARQVLRGDVAEGKPAALRNVHLPSLFEARLGFDDRVAQGYDDKELDSRTVPAATLAATRSAVAFTDRYTDTSPFDLKPFLRQGQIVSSTGQLRWQPGDEAGLPGGFFTLDTPATKAAVGFAQGRTLELGNLSITPESRFAAIYVTAREPDKDLESSREVLIVALARARNTGMKFSPGGDRMLLAGKPPILMEPVRAKIRLRRSGGAKLQLLDHNGLATSRSRPLVEGSVSLDGAVDKTPYYLLRY